MAEGGQAGNALAVPGGAGVSLERVGALAGDLRGRWAGMSGARRRWMATSALLIAAVIAALVWYAGRTEWRVLFSGLDAKDTRADCSGAVGGGDYGPDVGGWERD